jgi:ParB family chromosome partitioning protein
MMKAKEQVYQEVALTDIGRCPWQPRKRFDGPKFEELCKSVAAQGVLEPILLRRLRKPAVQELGDPNEFPTFGLKVGYELVAGERRFRAAWAAALANGGVEGAVIPAIVRELGDDEAFDIMTIENLHREDLTELEEAENFKAYLDRRGMSALEELAERTGIHARYIRRRVRLFSLPAEVLKAWDKGELSYGYLEQLNRLEDEKEILAIFREIRQGNSWRYQTVKQLKDEIDYRAPALKQARFDIEKTGCLSCSRNSEVQSELFDCERMKGAHCLDPKCFKQKQNNWFLANWKKTGFYKQHGTTGFRFDVDLDHRQFHQWYTGAPLKKCKQCPEFVTRIKLDGTAGPNDVEVCIGDESCFNATKKKSNHENTKKGKQGKEEDEPRVSWHGEYFREAFYEEQLPLRLQVCRGDDEKPLRVALFSLMDSESSLKGWFQKRHQLIDDLDEDLVDEWERLGDSGWGYSSLDPGIIFNTLAGMVWGELLADLREASALVLMKKADPDARRRFAEHFGIDLLKEWRITRDYLDKKTTAEIHAIAAEFGLWERKEAKAFLFETLNKKRGNFKSCKKDELVRIMLESGMDLAGVVPKEIRLES